MARNEINRRLPAFRGTPEYVAILETYGLTKADLATGEVRP